jgi:hypothetical protein
MGARARGVSMLIPAMDTMCPPMVKGRKTFPARTVHAIVSHPVLVDKGGGNH